MNQKEMQDKYNQLMIKYKQFKKNNLQEKDKDDGLPGKIQLLEDIDVLRQNNEFLLKANDLLKNEINKLNQNTKIYIEKIKQLETENNKIIKEYKKEEININRGFTLDKKLEEDNESKMNTNKSKVEKILFESEILKSKIKSINLEKQKIELENKKLVLSIESV